MKKTTLFINFFSSFTAKCILILLFLSTSITAQTIVEKHGRLRVNGNRIVDKASVETSLAGNSLFWSIAYDANDPNRELTNFYKAEVVDYLAQNWKSSIIRVAMGVKETWDSGRGFISDPEGQKAKIKVVIDAAIASGIYVIIDWHSHDAELYQEEAIAFFTEMFHDMLSLFSKPFHEDTFDFSDAHFFGQIAELGERYSKNTDLKKMNGNRGSKHFIYMNRTFFGLYNLMFDLKAQNIQINNYLRLS